jgi:tRNA G18 (ribose-2'-O)-methylase SpoU
MALVVGSEINGVSAEILNISNQIVHINMYGKNSSMNVVQATSIALYEIINNK